MGISSATTVFADWVYSVEFGEPATGDRRPATRYFADAILK
jgi:hypothetical protein